MSENPANDWPELDEAVHLRNEQFQKHQREICASMFLEELNPKIEDLFLARRWEGLIPSLQGLAETWGKPVQDLLVRLANAYWRKVETSQPRLKFYFTLHLPPDGRHPYLVWEAVCYGWYYSGWFIVELHVSKEGQPEFFIVITKEGESQRCPVEIPSLKYCLLGAFHRGPLVDIHRKRANGIALDLVDA